MQIAYYKFIIALSLFVLLVFVPQISNAQKGEFGVRFMPTVSSLDVQSSSGGQISGDATFGFGAGIFVGFNFSDHFGLQGEALYSTLNQKYNEEDVEKEIKLEYINIPLLLSFNTGKLEPVNFNVVLGPQIGISVGSELFTSDGGDPDNEAVLSVKKGDVGFAYGAGVDFGLNANKTFRLGLGFRGVYGLIDISDNSNNNSTNSYYVLDKAHIKTYSAYLGISFLF